MIRKHKDKIYHFAAGIIIALVVWVIIGDPEIGLFIAILAGTWKEVWDMQRKGHHADFFDFLMTMNGALLAYGVILWL